MPRNLFRLASKGAAGFLIGLAMWYGLAAPYAKLLASVSEFVVRVAERPPVTSITAIGSLLAVDRRDFPTPPSEGRAGIETMDITFNVILLTTLFAASSRPFSDRNVFGFLAAATLLAFVHVAAVVSFVKADYALNFGAWSAAHYGVVSRNFWAAAPYFYSIVGVHAAAFALWWIFRAWSTAPQKLTTNKAHKHNTANRGLTASAQRSARSSRA